jgi:hypothetical protein
MGTLYRSVPNDSWSMNDLPSSVKTLKPRHTNLNKERTKKIRRSNRFMPLYAIFHSISRKLVRPLVAPFPHMWRDTHHVNFIPIVLQPPIGLFDFIYQRVSPYSNPSNFLRCLWRAHAIGQDKVPTWTASPYLNQIHKNRWHLQNFSSLIFFSTIL